jgi:hypothetical protein
MSEQRILWRDFLRTETYKALTWLLFIAGYRLQIVFNDAGEATDVFIVTYRGD